MANILKSLGNAVKANKSSILACSAIGGMLAAAIWAVKSTPKAMKNIEALKADIEEKGEPITKLEYTKQVVKVTWKCYLPSVIVYGVSSACILGAVKNLEKSNMALSALLSLSEQNLKEYVEKTKELVGEKKEKQIHDAVMTDRVKSTGVLDNVVVTGTGKIPCVMTLENKAFESTANEIDAAINRLNARINNGEDISANDLYYELGIDFTKIGDDLGWPGCGKGIQRRFTSGLNDQDIPYLVFDFAEGYGPVYGYDKL